MATFEELTGLSVSKPAQRPLTTIHRTGADTRRFAGEEAARLDEENNFIDTMGAALQSNISVNLYDKVQRKWSHEAEEGFDVEAWVTENRDTLPGVNLEEFASVRSTGEAEELRADMLRAEENSALIGAKGYSGVAASLLAGAVDPAEIAIALGTGGIGKGTTTAARIVKAIGSGVTGGLLSGTAMYQVDPLADVKQVVFAGLTGAVVSSAVGGSAIGLNKATMRTRREYSSALNDLPPADLDITDAPSYDMSSNPMSLGAGALGDTPVDPDGFSPTVRSIYDQSMATIRDNDLGRRMDDTDFATADTPEARTAKRFSDVLANSLWTPARTDFDRLTTGGSRIELALGYNLLESPEGRLRNNRSGAMLKETYEQRLSSHSLPVLDNSYTQWARDRNVGIIDQQRHSTRTQFDREVIAELEARFHEGKPVSGDKHIKAAADAIDANYADALSVAKGRDGELSVTGFEDIKPQSGFFNHRWSGAAIKKALANGHTRQSIEDLLAQGYARTNPDMPVEYRNMVSKAVVRRALARDDGVDTNMLNTLDSDAQEYLRETLVDSGYDLAVIDNLIDSIRGRKEEASQLGTTKKRTQVDLRTNANGLSLMDLVDTNLTRVLSRYNREVSGNAALARKGIQNRAQRKQMIEAALAERRTRGLPADEDQRRFLEDIFTYFDSGPIGGGVSPMVARAKRLTNLALLNQMGLTQAGEAGAQIAAVGMDTWKRHASAVFKQMREQGPDGPIARELRPWMGNIGNEHMLFRDDLMMDELGGSADLNTFLGRLDRTLGKAQRLQGYVSGFYFVRSFQQRVATISMADKVMQRLRDGVDKDILDSIGMPQTLKKYIDDGTVTFDADGFVDRLNMNQWDAVDAEDFALALNRHTHQTVQKAMAGEESMWMHRSVGSLFMHLKSFPMMAMRKQSARLAGVNRPQAVAALLMGLATAGLAYEAKQLINGRTDRISGEDALKGAMGMSNMTGWVPMLVDPAAQVLGLNDLRFNQYGRHDINTGVIPLPPVIPTLTRMAQLPAAANPLSDLTRNERIRLMQTTPIVGNLYGFSALFNAMKK